MVCAVGSVKYFRIDGNLQVSKVVPIAQSRQSAKLFKVVGIGTPQTPHPQAFLPPPPPPFLGERHSRLRESGWENPNSEEGTYTVVLFIYTYFVVKVLQNVKILDFDRIEPFWRTVNLIFNIAIIIWTPRFRTEKVCTF